MKTVFITAYHGFIARNILNTDVLKLLRQDSDVRIVVFAPPAKKELFAAYYGGPNVIVEGLDLDPVIRTGRSKFWYRMAFVLQNSRYVKDQRNERLYRNRTLLGYANYLWVNAVAVPLSRLPLARWIYRWLDKNFTSSEVLAPLFEKYRPDLLFSTDVFGEWDVLFLRFAEKHGTPTLGMVRSWDNATTKGVLRFVPQRILVHSQRVKEELVQWHDAKDASVEVIGLPQFDAWIHGPTKSREDFFTEIGADPSKRLILFGPAGAALSDTDWQLCQILSDALEKGGLPPTIQFLVRNHPHHPADLSRFKGNPNFIFETPGITLKQGGEKGRELSPDEHDHLRNSVYYSDMVMYVATSLGLDASVFDKPQILVSFDGFEQKPYVQSVRRYNREDCLSNLISLGGTKVATNAKEWVGAINGYLANPALDHGGRVKTIERHMHILDGKAGERIAHLILNKLNG